MCEENQFDLFIDYLKKASLNDCFIELKDVEHSIKYYKKLIDNAKGNRRYSIIITNSKNLEKYFKKIRIIQDYIKLKKREMKKIKGEKKCT